MNSSISENITAAQADAWEQAYAARAQDLAKRARSLKTLRSAADVVQVVGWLAGAVGVLAGLLIAFITGETDSFLSDTTYPNLGAGIAVAASSIVTCALIVLLGVWAEAWARCNDGP